METNTEENKIGTDQGKSLGGLNRIEAVLGIVAAALLALGCLAVLRPFVSAILWSLVLAFTTWPLLLRLERRIKGRRTVAASLMVLLITLVMVLPFVAVGITLAENVSRIEDLFRFLQGGLPATAPVWLSDLPWIGSYIASAWPGFVQDTGWLSSSVKSIGMGAGKWLLANSVDFGKGIMQLVLSVVILFVLYRDGEQLTARLSAGAQRIMGDRSQHLLNVAGNTVRSVVYGIIGTALAQAIVAALGFWVAGVPSPFLLGLLTFLLALIPGGPPFVWIPATLWLFHEGHAGWGLFMSIWGLLGISGVDNVVRPYLISRGSNLPFIVVLLGVIGGLLAFGFIGIFLGPVLLAVGYAVIREFTASRPPPPAQPPTPGEG